MKKKSPTTYLPQVYPERIASLPTNHMLPLETLNGYKIRPGFYEINGAVAIPGGVSFTVHSHNAVSCELLLYHPTQQEPFVTFQFPEHYKIGHVYSMIIYGLNIEDFEYAYRLDGPYLPQKGLLFDKTKPLLDPYARAVTGQSIWGLRPERGFSYKARVVKNNFDWGNFRQPLIPMEDLIIYELHIRGFTKHSSSGVKHPGTFAGLMEKIPYLKKLGINAVELMPIFEFDESSEHRMVNGEPLMNYWGYNSVGFFSPNTSYASRPETNQEGTELKNLIKAMNENGIEVILDVVFNHTAEGNENGPYFCFKGFDNNIYYMLTPDGKYYNFSGCGNTLNCNHPIVQQMILECLRYWVTVYRVDGFRFDLASILGRNEDGSPMSKPPLLQSLAFDPILGNVKLIAEAWDAGGLYQVGSFPSWQRFTEWNGKYRDDLRSFLKGDYWTAPEAVQRIIGSPDLYNREQRGSNASINFLTCHDGFTLWDLYSYNEKHNDANGWNNTDGTNDNRSWNCGAEGETDNSDILLLRHRMVRNACAVLMCSLGTPMFLSGDEFGNTQFGNNNPYCQDNEISWLDWNLLKKNADLFEFFSNMIHFRKSHPAIRGICPESSCGLPPLSLHQAVPYDGHITSESKMIGIMYAARNIAAGNDDIVYMAVNPYWEPLNFTLPDLPDMLKWKIAVDTGAAHPSRVFYDTPQMPPADEGILTIGARSVMIFCAISVIII